MNRQKETLSQLGSFLEHDLDYDRIQRVGVGSVRKPLTSFPEDLKQGHFTPVARWQDRFPLDELMWFESLVGEYLRELGYPLSSTETELNHTASVKRMRLIYSLFYESKQWLKVNTPISRWMVNYSEILIDK
jgi:hypothetical protein